MELSINCQTLLVVELLSQLDDGFGLGFDGPANVFKFDVKFVSVFYNFRNETRPQGFFGRDGGAGHEHVGRHFARNGPSQRDAWLEMESITVVFVSHEM